MTRRSACSGTPRWSCVSAALVWAFLAVLAFVSYVDQHALRAVLRPARTLRGNGGPEGADSWPLDTCPGLAAVQCPASAVVGSGKRAVAVYLAGVKSRLLLNSTLERVLVPLVLDGFAVHVYVNLLFDSSEIGSWVPERAFSTEDRPIASLGRAGLQRYIIDRVASTGACVICAEVPARPEWINDAPENPGQIQKYPPSTTKAGQRLLRLWKARERLWTRSVEVESSLRMKYDLSMWVRDDAVWLGDLRAPSALLAAPDASQTVWSRSCGAFGGLNDKFVAFGRKAAPWMMTLYTSFMQGGLPAHKTMNAEHFLLAAAREAGLTVRTPPFEHQPEASAMILGSNGGGAPSLCAIKHYWCGGDLPQWRTFSGFCEEAVQHSR